ncbi:hypothetical protein [Nostoc sp. TCL26-01]|uniref:hypothetical protein n=1 Tax=Nostoc sp. TCL26-01 TaxID=2576904 RepID=UPI0015C0BE63|nr:hypothetical protein [Nostoc sp. TCL26-01]QLE56032.1 hypothetical protein FD725_11130 [Nostoc sp. TCL26-01]
MISLLKRQARFLAGFISGLVVAILLSWGTTAPQPAIAAIEHQDQVVIEEAIANKPEFFASHEEPNFYQ